MDEEQKHVTSPELETQDTLVKSARHFQGMQTLEMDEEDIQAAWRIVQRVRHKWMLVFRQKFNDPSLFKLDDAMTMVEQFEDEIKTELMEKVEVLATVNTLPLLEGQPLEIEWIGKLPTSSINTYGLDHERKAWNIKRQNSRGETLGE